MPIAQKNARQGRARHPPERKRRSRLCEQEKKLKLSEFNKNQTLLWICLLLRVNTAVVFGVASINKFTGGLYLKGNMANCTDFASSEQAEHEEYVTTVQPMGGTGTSPGMLGYMFWAAGIPSARKNYKPTYPPNSCEGGMGVAATQFNIPIPMPALRQE